MTPTLAGILDPPRRPGGYHRTMRRFAVVSLLLIGVLSVAPAPAAGDDPVDVTFRVFVEEGAPPADGTSLILRGRNDEEIRVSLQRGEATVRLSPGAWGWEIDDPLVASSGIPVLVVPGSPVVDLLAQRLGAVTLTLVGSSGDTSRVYLDSGGRHARGCESSGRSIECAAPVGQRILALRIEGWGPIPLGRHTITSSGLHLGEVRLPARGSLAGSIEGGEDVTVGLMRDTAVRRGSTERIDVARTDGEKRFRFDGIEPGTYWVDADSADGGAARWGPFVVADRAVEIEDRLELHPPARLSLQIVPAVDPLGEPWEVSLVAVSDHLRARLDVLNLDPPDEIGRVESGPLPPGRYILRIAFGESGATFGRRVLDLEPDAEAIELMILEPVKLIAEVRIDDNRSPGGMVEILPLEAEVNIDPSGSFVTYLPEEGTYTFDLVTGGRNVVRRVEVARDSSGEGRLVLDATTIELSGRVLHADGEPAAAQVVARWAGREQTAGTDPEGFYSFDVPRGIGRVELRALSDQPGRGSTRVPLSSTRIALEAGSTPLLERDLELLPMHSIEASVPPDAGAYGMYFGGDDYWRNSWGENHLRFPADLDSLVICILPRAAGLQCSTHRPTSGRASVRFVSGYGELVIETGGALVPSEIPPFHLYWNDTRIPGEVIETWLSAFDVAAPSGGRIVLPHVAAGNVRLCRVEISGEGVAAEGECVSGTVGEGRETLEIPEN